MSKKLTDDQIQRAILVLLDRLSETPGTRAWKAAKDDCRSIAEEIKEGDKYGVSEPIDCSREVRLNATIDRLRKERDDLKKELSDSYFRSGAYRELTEQDLQPFREYLGLQDYEAGSIAKSIFGELRTRKEEKERFTQEKRRLRERISKLKTQVEGLLAERKEALFAMGVVDVE